MCVGYMGFITYTSIIYCTTCYLKACTGKTRAVSGMLNLYSKKHPMWYSTTARTMRRGKEVNVINYNT